MTDEDLKHIIELITRLGKLDALGADEDFYDAGFSSINALILLMDLEQRFDVEIPDEKFVTARTARALYDLMCGLRA